MANHDNHHEHQGPVSAFFHHHAVTFFFGCLFLLMMFFGLVKSGAVDVPAGAINGFSQVPINALLIFLVWAGAMLFTFLFPRLMGVYFIVVLLSAVFYQFNFEFATEAVNSTTQAPGNQAPAPFLTMVYLWFAVFGTFVMFGDVLKKAVFGSRSEDEDEESESVSEHH